MASPQWDVGLALLGAAQHLTTTMNRAGDMISQHIQLQQRQLHSFLSPLAKLQRREAAGALQGPWTPMLAVRAPCTFAVCVRPLPHPRKHTHLSLSLRRSR